MHPTVAATTPAKATGKPVGAPANDNAVILLPSIDRAIPGQALTLSQSHRKFGRCYAEFVGHAGDGKHVLVRKLISSMWKSRWTKPMAVPRALVTAVHTNMASAS
jgi:hypothetical protein